MIQREAGFSYGETLRLRIKGLAFTHGSFAHLLLYGAKMGAICDLIFVPYRGPEHEVHPSPSLGKFTPKQEREHLRKYSSTGCREHRSNVRPRWGARRRRSTRLLWLPLCDPGEVKPSWAPLFSSVKCHCFLLLCQRHHVPWEWQSLTISQSFTTPHNQSQARMGLENCHLPSIHKEILPIFPSPLLLLITLLELPPQLFMMSSQQSQNLNLVSPWSRFLCDFYGGWHCSHSSSVTKILEGGCSSQQSKLVFVWMACRCVYVSLGLKR